ncbi:CTP synthase ura7 [Basidiobolus ranarum]|uniref:CTP synthase (glutamine hydrolyzing) n=1 Tax=Basidiobolus ranarum TaxID=34480 RepID=A0ABR2VLG3_9FUNG
MFCHVSPECVLNVRDVSSIYHVPLLLQQQGALDTIRKRLNLDSISVSSTMIRKGHELWRKWRQIALRHDHPQNEVNIALVGKYTYLHDSYCSVVKALEHASLSVNTKLNIKWVEGSDLEPESQQKDPVKYADSWQLVTSADGILVPGGFGIRGTEGKILAIKWARENNIPYLGICLGLQLAAIEFARNVCGIKDGHSEEFVEDAPHSIAIYMPEISKTHLGGTMRLGARPTIFQEGSESSKIRRLYNGERSIDERHRHRYEINPAYIKTLESQGLKFVGHDESGERMIILEKEDHPYFVASQFHPEYITRPLKPSPPFVGLILAAAGLLDQYLESNSFALYDPDLESDALSVDKILNETN